MAFATVDDVAERFPRDLTEAEQAIAASVIDSISLQIAEAVDRDEEWADDLDPVPATFKAVCVEKAISAISNPSNVAQQSKRMGSFSHSQTFPREQDTSALLNDAEERRVRRAWYGANSGSARTESAIHDVLDYRDDGEINDSLPS